VYPTLLHLGHLYLPTFGVLAAVGLMLALALSERTAKLAHIPPAKLWDAGIFAVIAAFVLSRLLLVITHFKTFVAFPILLLAVPSLTATGLLLTILVTAAWLWFKRVPILAALDAWAPCGALVWAALALGHFAEGSDPGMPTTLPWGLRPMPGEEICLHPIALYAAFIAFLIAAISFRLLHRPHPAGSTAGWTLAYVGLAQYSLTFLRQPGATALNGLELLEWASLAMLIAGVALVFFAKTRTQPASA